MSEKERKCPVCGENMHLMYGCGWDYDRWVCPIRRCGYEIELETSSFYDGWEEDLVKKDE